MNDDSTKKVPEDFPRDYFLGGVSGAQPKLLAREIGGKFIVGPTAEEIYERWDAVEELARGLADDTLSKLERGEIGDLLPYYVQLARGMRYMSWDLTQKEQLWVHKRMTHIVAERLGKEPPTED